MTVALYSLVHYVDDVERRNAVNVGVLLSADSETLKKFAEREELTPDQNGVVHRFEGLLDYLIEHDDRGQTGSSGRPLETHEPFLSALARRRFPHFEITEPRQLSFDGDPQDALNELVRRLLDPDSRHAVR